MRRIWVIIDWAFDGRKNHYGINYIASQDFNNFYKDNSKVIENPISAFLKLPRINLEFLICFYNYNQQDVFYLIR